MPLLSKAHESNHDPFLKSSFLSRRGHFLSVRGSHIFSKKNNTARPVRPHHVSLSLRSYNASAEIRMSLRVGIRLALLVYLGAHVHLPRCSCPCLPGRKCANSVSILKHNSSKYASCETPLESLHPVCTPSPFLVNEEQAHWRGI